MTTHLHKKKSIFLKRGGKKNLYHQKLCCNEVIRKVTLSFTPYPLFDWYPQRKFLLNLSMKCWNSAFIEQAPRVNYRSCTGRSSEELRGKRREGMKLNLPPKLVEKLVWVPVISFCKISFPVKHLMPYNAETGRSRSLIAWLYGKL